MVKFMSFRSLILIAVLGWSDASFAEMLADPTLPPATMAADAGVTATASPVLQSVTLGAGRKSAMISGQVVKVGEKFGDATLVSVSDHEAILRNPDRSLQTLSLYPNVEKKTRIIRRNTGVKHPPETVTQSMN